MFKRNYENYSKRQQARLKNYLEKENIVAPIPVTKSNSSIVETDANSYEDREVYYDANEKLLHNSEEPKSSRDELNTCDDFDNDCDENCFCSDYRRWTENDNGVLSESEESGNEEIEDEDKDEDEEKEDDEDGTHSDNFNDILDSSAHEPLYPGAPITLVESIISILLLTLSFNITGVLLTKILELIEMHCIKPNRCLKTLYKFKKFFKDLKTPLIRHLFCTQCFSKLKTNTSMCTKCETNEHISYFLEIPIIFQLKTLFKRPKFYETISTHRFHRKKINKNCLEDIYDGHIYENLVSEGFLSHGSNISFTWNTDGVPLFKSSKFSIWPFFLSINELPYEERIIKENIIIAGIWFGVHKPVPNLFLSFLRDSLEKLYSGIFFKTSSGNLVKSRAKVICGTCDLCAKSLFLNMKQFNGWCGCQKCKIRGQRIANVHTYPFEKEMSLRTSAETIQFATEAKALGSDIFGVKGPTILAEITHDFIVTTTVDVMHCIYLNVLKRLMSIWFNAEYYDHAASLRPFLFNINKALTSIRPIDSIVRRPRSLDDFSYWKASELKAFLLVYSLPILNDYMHDVFFNHHILLVFAITLLNSSSISEEMLNKAEHALIEYVKRFEILYNKEHMTANIHLILHLPDAVKQYGPLYVTSCFPFENLNGILKSYVHGSKNPELQIYSSVSTLLNLDYLKSIVKNKNSAVALFCSKIEQRSKKRRKSLNVSNNMFIIGAWYKDKIL